MAAVGVWRAYVRGQHYHELLYGPFVLALALLTLIMHAFFVSFACRPCIPHPRLESCTISYHCMLLRSWTHINVDILLEHWRVYSRYQCRCAYSSFNVPWHVGMRFPNSLKEEVCVQLVSSWNRKILACVADWSTTKLETQSKCGVA